MWVVSRIELIGSTTESDSNDQVRDVVEEFCSVLNMPMGLPPIRDCNHAINLLEGKISVRPYRYEQIQKNEIESLLKEMFAAVII